MCGGVYYPNLGNLIIRAENNVGNHLITHANSCNRIDQLKAMHRRGILLRRCSTASICGGGLSSTVPQGGRLLRSLGRTECVLDLGQLFHFRYHHFPLVYAFYRRAIRSRQADLYSRCLADILLHVRACSTVASLHAPVLALPAGPAVTCPTPAVVPRQSP